MKIWFDMDGTLADLYNVNKWLEKLNENDPTPYRDAKPLLRMATLARVLNRLIREGHEINIISWLPKDACPEYEKAVAIEKRKWLKTHLASVTFTNIDIAPYGTAKNEGRNGILFDDEEQNRKNWGENAYDVNNILDILKAIQEEKWDT